MRHTELLTAEAVHAAVRAQLDAVDAAHDSLRSTCTDLAGNAFRIEVAERLEAQQRANRGLSYRMFGEVAEPIDGTNDPGLPAGVKVRDLLASRLRLTAGEVRRRFRVASRIRPRRSLTGPSLPAELPILAAAVEAGELGEDHIGAVPYLLREINVPVYGPKYALELVRERLQEHDLDGRVDLIPTKTGELVKLPGISFESVRVTHSIADATALAFRTPAGVIVHTGDFKIDLAPTDNEPFDVERFRTLGDEGVRLLLSDSTNADVAGASSGEAPVIAALARHIAEAKGRVVISLFASNVHRLRG
ncbi:MAG TPA: DUF222 domain-containing protein, partial [Mycobacterium sp.]|nr:DUF222 domain-containing protein [Mycobacterium sp.]